MKKIIITGGLLLSMLCGQAQMKTAPESNYEVQKLKIDEINFVSSYYRQDGDKSAVTGGIGTEYLFDIANSIDLKMSFSDKKKRKHSLNADFNVDYYSSASSDNIDPRTISGASRSDVHIYPSLSWSMKNDKNGTTRGISYSYSTEWDYHSHGVNLSFSKLSKDNNREFSVKAGVFLDKWTIILPAELRTSTTPTRGSAGETKPRNSYNTSFSLSQVINKRLQVMLVFEPAYQEGLLSTPFHRIYFTNNTVTVEKLPGSRLKFPVGARLSYFLGDKTILRGFYRFYADDWGMTAHTVNLESTIKITPFFSISPFYRFNTQTRARYFAPYLQHNAAEAYYTSDYDISSFDSHFIGAGIRIAPPGGILGMRHFHSAELRYGHYYRNTVLNSDIVTLALKMK